MLRINLNPILRTRGIRDGYRFLKTLGVSHSASYRMMSSQVKSITFSNVQKICEGLHCTPNDLLEWVPDEKTLSDTHPLNELIRSDQLLNLMEELRNIPLHKLEKLQEQIKELKSS